MSEREKMLNGEIYNSRDPELIALYHKARKLMQMYNTLSSEESKTRERILTDLLAFKGKGVWIEAPFYCDYGAHISVGANSFINMNCLLLDDNYITIGKNALLGPSVQIYTANHPLKASERIVESPNEDTNTATYLTYSQPVTIGDNVWIGGNTVIMPGVTIGNNVTIGAASLVTKDIPDHVLAFGNPCRVIRTLD